MSTAAAFKFRQPFPFCAKDISASMSGNDYVGNLTLQQVMDVYWKLETFTLATAGTVTDGGGVTGGTTSFTLNPVAGTPWTNGGAQSGAWYDLSISQAFASWPSPKAPRGRVCNSFEQATGGVDAIILTASGNPEADFYFELHIGTDPDNAGKYRVYYFFTIKTPYVSGVEPPELWFMNPAADSYAGNVGSGSFTLAGLTMNWVAVDGTGTTTPSGIDMSASSSNYTF